MHLEQLPSGSWRVTVQHAGHKRRDTRPTKTEARLHGAQLLLEMSGRSSLPLERLRGALIDALEALDDFQGESSAP